MKNGESEEYRLVIEGNALYEVDMECPLQGIQTEGGGRGVQKSTAEEKFRKKSGKTGRTAGKRKPSKTA